MQGSLSNASSNFKLADTAPNLPKNTSRGNKEDLLNTDRFIKKEDGNKQLRSSASTVGNEIWVKKWVDYSSKYGLGYTLSNGSTGVFFNDSTKIVLGINNCQFKYYERKGADKQDICKIYSLTDYPKELQKKITLLQHFRSYLDGDAKQETGEKFEENGDENTIYVKK